MAPILIPKTSFMPEKTAIFISYTPVVESPRRQSTSDPPPDRKPSLHCGQYSPRRGRKRHPPDRDRSGGTHPERREMAFSLIASAELPALRACRRLPGSAGTHKVTLEGWSD